MSRRDFGSVVIRGSSVGIRFRDAAGRKRYESLPKGSARKQAELLLARRRLELERGTWIEPARTTVGEFLADWLPRSGVEDTTLAAYDLAVRRLQPLVGGLNMQRLTLNHVERAKEQLTAAGLAPKTVNNTLDVGRRACNWAVQHNLLVANPFEVARLAVNRAPREALEPAAATRLLEELLRTDDLLDLAAAFMLLTLRRYSEMAGLRHADVNLAAREYALSQVYISRTQTMKPARPDARKGKLARHQLTDTAVGVLRRAELAQRVQREDCRLAAWEWQDSGLVFTADLGGPVPLSSLHKALAGACRRAGVPRLSPHELRHTGASLLIASGADKWQLMAAGGWSSLAMVERHYGHLFAERTRLALEGMEALLGRKQA